MCINPLYFKCFFSLKLSKREVNKIVGGPGTASGIKGLRALLTLESGEKYPLPGTAALRHCRAEAQNRDFAAEVILRTVQTAAGGGDRKFCNLAPAS